MNHGENTEVEAQRPLLASPEAENATAEGIATGILGDDSLLGPALEGEALEEQVRLQVEYFLSREYLSTDPYLVSQMNSDMYFPITTVATLTTYKVDLEILVKALRKSTALTVNENGTMVKPSFKIQRNTLILRDIPSSTKVEEVQGIFQGEGCPAVTGIRPDIGDCWFVTFTSEEDALKALDFVRGRTFHDVPVKARIKSENLLRATYYPPAPAADLGMKVSGHYGGGYYYSQYGGQHTQDLHQDHRRQRGGGGGGGHRQPSGGANPGVRKDYRNKYNNGTAGHTPTTTPTGSSPVVAGAAGGASSVASPPVPNTHTRGSQAPTDSDNRKQRRPSNRGNRKQDGGPLATTTTTPTPSTKPSQGQPPLQLGLAHFPPLSSQPQSKPRQSGYTKDFTKFTKQQLIDIVTSTQVPNQQPSSFPTECLATLAEPNTQVVISPESNLDRLRPAQEDSVSASPRQEGEEAANSTTPSTSTLPTPTTTPAQPTITMASLVATHKSIPAPAPKKPQAQPKAKPAAQPKKEPAAPAQGKGQQQNAKKASPPAKAAAAQKKKPEDATAPQPSAGSSSTSSPSPTPTPTPTPESPAPAAGSTNAAAAAAPAPASPAAVAPAAASPAAPAASPSTSSPSSTPTYAQQAAKAASKLAHAQPKEAKKAEAVAAAEKKVDEKKEEKESPSA